MKEIEQKFKIGDIITNGQEIFRVKGILKDAYNPLNNAYIIETSPKGDCDRMVAVVDQDYWYKK